MELIKREYRTITGMTGPLVFVKGLKGVGFNELCEIMMPGNVRRTGQILQISGEITVVQVLEGTSGIDSKETSIIPLGETVKAGVSVEMLGRVFNGAGKPADNMPGVIPEKFLDAAGLPLNPASREKPTDFFQTGISAIDGLNTLVRGQKLPIFSGAGLPAKELAMRILSQAKIAGEEEFCVILGAMGITSREAFFYRRSLELTGATQRTVAFLNLASEPAIERLFTPRLALTTAEYFAFEKGYHVMVILTDMTAYCDALREIASAREEIPGRRSYPGYMYTDLAGIYERAGRVRGKKGSVTVIPILTMPDDDITHPIPDLTGYITEGQIVLSRSLNRRGIFPPIDALPCLSRLMNLGIGEGKTREGHRKIADRLYSAYARGMDLRKLVTIVGEEGLTDLDRRHLGFADEFEKRFIGQGNEDRDIGKTLELGMELLKMVP